MYPLGESKPHGLWDVAGNVWEWIGSWYDYEQTVRVLRGGAWDHSLDFARTGFRYGDNPDYSDLDIGFRLVSDIRSETLIPGSDRLQLSRPASVMQGRSRSGCAAHRLILDLNLNLNVHLEVSHEQQPRTMDHPARAVAHRLLLLLRALA